MRARRSDTERGFTLLELTIAVAVFIVILAATAQALVSYYVTMDIQNQRVAAVRNCTGVISAMRSVRDANPGDFPDAIVDQWPDGAVVSGAGSLPQEQITVHYTDSTANPLEVTVTSQWADLRGRSLTTSVSSLLTDR
ncbi:MAG: type II secretion system protein [Candidatus Hydrogenedentes bacterium]|nr:type II secretion system protein [Candidatus Hydrogenedentota bacterium]